MKFKHTFNVFVDNFKITYKLLLYRLIITALFLFLGVGVISPLVGQLTGTDQFKQIGDALTDLGAAFIGGSGSGSQQITIDFTEIGYALTNLLNTIKNFLDEVWDVNGAVVAGGIAILTVVYIVQGFFQGLGNYTAGALINDKMAMQADSPFIGTMIKNLARASLYNLIYVPLSFLYDAAVAIILYLLFFKALNWFAPASLFLFVTIFIILRAIKMVFTTDWLPALVYGQMGQGQAMCFAFSRKNKGTGAVFSDYLILSLLILAINVAALLFTFGAGFLITLPASYILILSYEFVNYCDCNEIKYFIDKNTIIKPAHEPNMTKQQFFTDEK